MEDVRHSGTQVIRAFTDHDDTVLAMAWSPDGKTIATACKDGAIKHWRLADGRLLLEERSKHAGPVRSIAWATNSVLATASEDKSLVVWEVQTHRTIKQHTLHSAAVTCIAWSPNKDLLASGSWDMTIILWDPKEQRRLQKLDQHTGMIHGLAWAPSKHRLRLASCSEDKTIRIWEVGDESPPMVLRGHTEAVRSVAWSPDGRLLASCSDDKTIRIWDPETGQLINELEGHTGVITGVAFSHQGRFLASKSDDGTVRLWRLSTCETVRIIRETSHEEQLPAWLTYNVSSAPVFSPTGAHLLTIGQYETEIVVHQLDFRTLEQAPPVDGVVHYTNAKVVLLGNSGVGKSGLALRLTNRDFEATISSHGRKVYPFDRQLVVEQHSQRLTRETYLWDLAGQPGYRLIHQLYLNEAAVAIVVFDAQSEIDPFAGVRYWARALKQAQRIQDNKVLKMRKFLVAARVDRGAIQASDARIESLRLHLDFDEYIETSAKENRGVEKLREQIIEVIDWKSLPKVTSTTLFQRIKYFLAEQQEYGNVVERSEVLYHDFLRADDTISDSEPLKSSFRTCIELLERSNLVRRLSFGDYVLLSPEKLDSYAAVLVNAAREEPDGMGSVEEARIPRVVVAMSPEERITDERQEQLLLLATKEDLLHHEIALRETVQQKTFLVFPSELTRERQDLPDPQGKAVSYTFEGATFNIYATLIVRLTHSGVFTRVGLWKSAATYRSEGNGMCGLFLEEPGDGQGKITLFFEASVKAETRHQFETFIENHLKRRAIRDSIRRRPIISCTSCGFTVTEQMIELFMQINTVVFPCPICQAAGRNTHISLRDPRLDDSSRAQKVILDMDQAADAERQRATAIATLQGKQATGDYDLFLWFHRTDRAFAQNIGTALEQHGILAWLQEWSGERDQPVWSALQSSLPKIKKVGFVMGRDSLSSWRHPDVPTLLRIFRDRQIAVLPILLPNFPQDVEPPPFLQGMGRVDFRVRDPNPLRQLLRGITGKTGLTPDTQLSLSQLTHRLSLYRTQLGHYLNQLAITGSAHVTPEVTAGIREARSEIARIKAHLRTQGATVTDLPDDFD